ncbi:flavin reductase family protein [Sporosarcina pasteurii]|uniref:Flavin-dependent monooxygenase, reductase subunit HsaB n=1 Tax=Sporosarcina pasteurii TaxID=1474 RepID=A0A380BCK0_SPOPA|nr:flavin reductase family protein [Sporosarcina pasteurii]MDS9472850.1 flavin reductase family protein [Sporosarcina pasteurii]QBQ06403.1 flavin reductase [Sporosarcina pasteurii]SUI98779.1 Flavin-dependent monooxygenase, reductase subunit HsaB [Sporosarcina pasteurii]
MDDLKFRKAMGKFASGVTVITTDLEDDVHGMTANAFMSLSLHPKLVVVSIDNRAHMLEKIRSSKKYAVNILAEDQQILSMNFAGQLKENIDISFATLSGQSVLEGAVAQVTCEVVNEHVEGDHTLFIGKVTDIHIEDREPLLFYNGKYRSLKEEKVVETV